MLEKEGIEVVQYTGINESHLERLLRNRAVTRSLRATSHVSQA
jgi:hypothetical protein